MKKTLFTILVCSLLLNTACGTGLKVTIVPPDSAPVVATPAPVTPPAVVPDPTPVPVVTPAPIPAPAPVVVAPPPAPVPAPTPILLGQPSRDDILALTAGLNPESSTALQAVVDRLAAKGYQCSVMAGGTGTPSDHKVWINGAAWTLISSNAFQPGTFRFDPYIQVGSISPYSACGIPLNALTACPPWFVK